MGHNTISHILRLKLNLVLLLRKCLFRQVSHLEFWQRYLFRKALLEDEEARREAMERRAEKERQAAENFQWDQGKSLN